MYSILLVLGLILFCQAKDLTFIAGGEWGTLPEIWKVADDAIFSETIEDCRSAEFEKYNTTYGIPCDKVEYIYDVKEDYDSLMKEVSTFESNIGNLKKGDENILESQKETYEGLKYITFFQKFATLNKPLHVENGPVVLSDEAMEDVNKCWKKDTLSLSLHHDCQASLSKVTVPKFVGNDYLRRININNDESVVKQINEFPKFYQGKSSVVDLQSCPIGSQMILSVVEGDVEFKIFDEQQKALLSPDIVVNENGYEYKYGVNVWENNFDKNALFEFAKYNYINGAKNDLIYVPSKSLVSWKYGEKENNNKVVQFCYLDAGNYMSTLDMLSTESHISSASESISRLLLNSNFDKTMDRNVDTLSWASYITWPREKAVEKTEVVEKTEDSAPKRGGRGDRKRKGKKSLADWQTDSVWKLLVTSLTLPTPSTPIVSQIFYSHAYIKFQTPYEINPTEELEFGYNVTWIEVDSKFKGNSIIPAELSTRERFIDFRNTNHKTYDIEVKVDGLKPETKYVFTCSLYLGEATSSESRPSNTVQTKKPTVPAAPYGIQIDPNSVEDHKVSVFTWASEDDGGLPIQEYLLEAKVLKDHGHTGDWHVIARIGEVELEKQLEDQKNSKLTRSKIQFEVEHLHPETTYSFRAGCSSENGMSRWTLEEKVTTKVSSDDGVVKTIKGHVLKNKDNDPSIQILQVDDANHIINHLSGGLTAWCGYHSPKKYITEGEFIFVEPIDASTDLTNAKDVHGRIAMIKRCEKVALVHKILRAQKAGAIAVLIIAEKHCDVYDQNCAVAADYSLGIDWGKWDAPNYWTHVHIPHCIIPYGKLERIHDNLGTRYLDAVYQDDEHPEL